MAEKQGVLSVRGPKYERGIFPRGQKISGASKLIEAGIEALNPYPMNLQTGERELAAPGLFEAIAMGGRGIASAIKDPSGTYEKLAPVLDEMGKRMVASTTLSPGQMAFVDGELRPLTSDEVIQERIDAGMDPTVALTGAAPIAARTAKAGVAGLAAEPGTLTAFGVPATAEKPFVTRGAQFLEDKVKGNFAKKDLLNQINASDLPQTDKIMLKQAVDAAQTDQRGRVNQFSLRDEYQKVSPENRTRIEVVEPGDAGYIYGSFDNLTGEDLGIIQIGVDVLPTGKYLDSGFSSEITKFMSVDRFDDLKNIENNKVLIDQAILNNPELQFLQKPIDDLYKQKLDLADKVVEERQLNSLVDLYTGLAQNEQPLKLPNPLGQNAFARSKSARIQGFLEQNPEIAKKILIKRSDVLDSTSDGFPSQAKDYYVGLEEAAQALKEKGIEGTDGFNVYNLARYDKDGSMIYSFDHPDKITAYIGPQIANTPDMLLDAEKEAEKLLFKYADPSVRQFFEKPPVADAVIRPSLEVGSEGSKVKYSQLRIAATGIKDQLAKRNRALQDTITADAKQLDKELVKKGFKPDVYRPGQHSALEIKDPSTATMSAARYADVDATLPDGTSVEGMHIAELQSDYADDLRKLGPTNKTAALDDVEAIQLEGELVSLDWKIEDSKTPDLPEGDPSLLAERKSIRGKQKKLQERVGRSRLNIPNDNMYAVPELYPEMGERGNAQQIIEIIGATMGAVKRGKNSVSFPIPDDIGSSVAKPLYDPDKFNNNIREAVKRMGKDYKATLIEFTDKNGDVVQRPGITWSGTEPAIGKENIGGVKMFRSGGIIDIERPIRGNSGIVDVIKQYRRDGLMD